MNGFSRAVVRIYSQNNFFAGMGVLLGKRRIVTTAGVVNEALKLSPWVGMPLGWVAGSSPFLGELNVEFLNVLPGELIQARVIRYYPALADRSGDLAELEIVRDPPRNTSPLCLKFSDRLFSHKIEILGVEPGLSYKLDGILFGHDRCNWVQYQLDLKHNYFADGLRGTPIWDRQLQGIVGIIGELGFSQMGVFQPMGLANGAPVILKAFPHVCKLEVDQRDLNKSGFERVELRISNKAMRPHEDHVTFIRRMMDELENLLGKTAKGKLRLFNLLFEQMRNHYRLVIDFPVDAIQKMEELVRIQDVDLVRIGVESVHSLFGETCSVVELASCAFSEQLIQRESIAKAIDLQVDDSLQRLSRSFNQISRDMEQVRGQFLHACGVALRQWYWVMADRIVRAEHEHTAQLSQHEVDRLKSEVYQESDHIEEKVRIALKKGDLWWHIKPGDQRYKLFDFNGRLRGAGEIEVQIRKVSERLRTILRRYGYTAENYWNEHPFDWTPEMKDAFNLYEELREKAAEVYMEMNKVKDTQIKYSSKGKAGKMWEN